MYNLLTNSSSWISKYINEREAFDSTDRAQDNSFFNLTIEKELGCTLEYSFHCSWGEISSGEDGTHFFQQKMNLISKFVLDYEEESLFIETLEEN